MLDACHRHVDVRIATSRQAMDEAQSAANEETKSSVGDKYETGRSMMQLESQKAAMQLEEALKVKAALDRLPPESSGNTVTTGSLVITNTIKILIAVGIGRVKAGEEEVFVVAPASPIGKTLIGLSTGDSFEFNKQQFVIQQVV